MGLLLIRESDAPTQNSTATSIWQHSVGMRLLILLLSYAAAQRRRLECQNTAVSGPDRFCDDPFAPVCVQNRTNAYLEPDQFGHACVVCSVDATNSTDGCPLDARFCVDDNFNDVSNGTGTRCTGIVVGFCQNTGVVQDSGCSTAAPVCVGTLTPNGYTILEPWSPGVACVACVPSTHVVDEGCSVETPICENQVCISSNITLQPDLNATSEPQEHNATMAPDFNATLVPSPSPSSTMAPDFNATLVPSLSPNSTLAPISNATNSPTLPPIIPRKPKPFLDKREQANCENKLNRDCLRERGNLNRRNLRRNRLKGV